MTQNIAFYLRSTSANQTDLLSQKVQIEKEFKRRGFNKSRSKIHLFVDEQSSGHRFGPELERLKNEIQAQQIEVVFMARLNRISRNLKGLTDFLAFLKTYDVRLITFNENLDTFSWKKHLENQRGAK